jgi:hypothetical protein
MIVPNLRVARRNGYVARVYTRSVIVHHSSGLGAEVAVLDDEVQCGNGISAEWALEGAKAVCQFDGVMPHTFKSRRLLG